MKPETNNESPKSKAVKKQSDERQERLAKALRSNLSRRKAISRAQSSHRKAQGD